MCTCNCTYHVALLGFPASASQHVTAPGLHVGPQVYIYGGQQSDTRILESVEVVDTRTMTSSGLLLTSKLDASIRTERTGASLHVWGEKLVVVGGLALNGSRRIVLDDVIMLDLRTLAWQQMPTGV